MVNRRYHSKDIDPPCSLPLDPLLTPGDSFKRDRTLVRLPRLAGFSNNSRDWLMSEDLPNVESANTFARTGGRLCFSWALLDSF